MTGRAAPALVILLLAGGLLAGCVSPGAGLDPAAGGGRALDPLTEPTLALGEFLSVKVPGHDGTPLHVDLQLPEGSGPFPVLVAYTPYSNNLNADEEAYGLSGGAEFVPALVDYYVPRGYAFALAHVRGTGQSGGCFTVGGPDEAKDGYAIVEWLANQSWSNGRVAMMGTSYLGTTPISTATLSPPHLTTIVPVAAVTEWYRYYFENGEPRFFGELPFGVVYTDQPLWAALPFIPKPRNPEAAANAPQNAQCAAAQLENAYAQDDYNGYWMARNYVKDIRNATAPMLYAHGFLDENTPTSLVPDFYNAYPAEKRMWLQQHGHGVPASFEAYHLYVHRWLDHWMLDRDNGALDQPAVVLQDNRGKYHALPEWPLGTGATLALNLTADGALAPEAAPEGTASYRDLPVAMEELRALAPVDGTFLRFEYEVPEPGLHLSGAPVLTLAASSSATDTQFAALLYAVKDGEARFVTRGYLDARHRDGLASGSDLEPGKEYVFRWALHARDHHLEAGETLVLVVASTDKYVVPDAPGAENALRFGPDGSRLELPVLDLAATAFLDAPPVAK